MVLYIVTILLGMAGIFAGNFFINPADLPLWKIILFTVLQPIIMIAWDGLGAYIIHWVIPGRLFLQIQTSLKLEKKNVNSTKLLELKNGRTMFLNLAF